MQQAQEILKHIDELYLQKVDLQKIENMPETNPIQYQAWVDAFKDYDLSDVLLAIDEYWEFKNSKTKPNVAQIKAILNAKKTEKQREITPTVQVAKCGDYSWNAMAADIEAGCNRNSLPVYRDAEKIVTSDWLLREIPADVWRKMSQQSRVKVAMEKGLFNNFDEALRQAAQARFGRDFEFLSKNDLENQKNSGTGTTAGMTANESAADIGKTLAAHWKMGA